jgi:hypothetical protein
MIFPEIKQEITYDFCLSFLGKKIKKWLIEDIYTKNYRTRFKVICECGRKSDIVAYRVFKNLTSSCVSCGAKKHGKFRTSTWRSWNGAKNRCNNKNNKDYAYYGGRGITFFKGWYKFDDFLRDMGEKPQGLTLDRINNNGNYEPSNCRWATYSQQNLNQRRHNPYPLDRGVN